MKRIAAAVIGLVLTGFLGGAAFIYSGLYNIAAKDAHWPVTLWVIEKARDRSVEVHAAGIRVPASLDDEAKIAGGAGHFATHCAVCHGAPGVAKDDIAGGMYPQPPDLDHASRHFTPAELFWIVKNGIKLTGMPSWADHGDDELWDIVAFLEKLPAMPPDEYGRLVAAAETGPGYRHAMTGPSRDGMRSMGGHDPDAPGGGHDQR